MCEAYIHQFLDEFFHASPVTRFIADFFAPGANGQQGLESEHRDGGRRK